MLRVSAWERDFLVLKCTAIFSVWSVLVENINVCLYTYMHELLMIFCSLYPPPPSSPLSPLPSLYHFSLSSPSGVEEEDLMIGHILLR